MSGKISIPAACLFVNIVCERDIKIENLLCMSFEKLTAGLLRNKYFHNLIRRMANIGNIARRISSLITLNFIICFISEENTLKEKKGLTEEELKKLRARFKRRQNKFAAIKGQTQIRIAAGIMPHIAVLSPRCAEEAFEKVDVDINPIITETNKGKKNALLNKSTLLERKSAQRSKNEDAYTTRSSETFSQQSSLNSSTKANKVSQSGSSSSTANSINKLRTTQKRKETKKKSSETNSSLEFKIDKVKSIKSRPNTLKNKVKVDMGGKKMQNDKGTRMKKEDHVEFRACPKKLKLLKNHKKKASMEDVKETRQVKYGMTESEKKNRKDRNVVPNEKVAGHKLKSETSNLSSVESSIKAELLPANTFLEEYPQSTQDINLLLKPIEMTKKDQSLYEKMDDEIVLDTNLLQSLATDLITESKKVNKDVLGDDIAKKLIEIEKKDQSTIDQDHIKEQREVVVSEIAKRIVEALTSNQVLGKVLTPEEAVILRDYFSRKIPLSEKVLATLDTALDKILRRAHEFYDDKKELGVFLKDRDSAKTKVLDALIAKKSNYLADLMTDASFYADRISKGLIDAYKLATEGILIARDNLQYMQAAVGHTYRYSKDMAYRGAALTYETAARGKELAEIGASVSTQMTYDAAKLTLDAAVRGKQFAEKGAAIGSKMTSDAAKMTLDAAIRGKQLAEQGAAIGTKMTSDAAKMTLDAVNRGKELAERSAAIGTKMTSDAAKMTLDAAIRGKQLAEQGAAIGTKMTSDAAKITYDVTNRGRGLAGLGIAIGAKMTEAAASKGLQIAEGTIHAASKGTQMVKDNLTAANSTTLDCSETALESAVQATKLVGEKVTNLTGAMNQARSDIRKSSEWILSFFQRPVCGISGTSEVEDTDNDSSDDNSDKNEASLSVNEKSKVVNQ
ncbi:unnamed protein product [Brugia pahangi]|uniref:I/LWEQ domain-containing protein n=1 Tax=Brugia pahangi TaxID=6280 RepID=A0A0N4TJJ7_BRUPA|nr:unnamed protein product [Brugia pahangi]